MTPLFRRRSSTKRTQLFDDLPRDVQLEAIRRYKHMTEKWGRDLPGWRRAILIGQAKRWAMTSEEERSQWGRSMLAKRGGYAVQRLYRSQGRTGTKHPVQKAAKESARRRQRQKTEPVLHDAQTQCGIAKTKHKLLPIW